MMLKEDFFGVILSDALDMCHSGGMTVPANKLVRRPTLISKARSHEPLCHLNDPFQFSLMIYPIMYSVIVGYARSIACGGLR